MSSARSVLLVLAACGSSAPPPAALPENTAVATIDAAPAPIPDDGCTLELAAIEGKLRHDDASLKTIKPPTRVDRRVTESAQMGNATVELSLGGCVHYGWELTYRFDTLPPKVMAADPASILKLAAFLTRMTPIEDDLGTDMARRIDATTPPPPTNPGPWSIECGDAVCDVAFEKDPSGGFVLRVNYDFPL